MQSLRQPFPAHYLLGQEINSSTQALTTDPLPCTLPLDGLTLPKWGPRSRNLSEAPKQHFIAVNADLNIAALVFSTEHSSS